MVALNIWTTGFLKASCVLIGSMVGYIAGYAIGLPNPTAGLIHEPLDFIRFPFHSHPGWQFDITLLAPFVVAAIAGTLHLLGAISTAQKINDADWVRPDIQSLARRPVGQRLGDLLRRLHRQRRRRRLFALHRARGRDRRDQPARSPMRSASSSRSARSFRSRR